MSRWFRHYAGMMRDEKLVRVALQSKQPIERVLWVWGAILESAAEINDAGRFDLEASEIAYFLRTDEADIRAVFDVLETMGRIHSGAVVKWGERQFQSDSGAERQRRYRQNKKGNVTQHNGDAEVTSPSRNADAPETETETEKNIRPAKAARSYDDKFEEAWQGYPRRDGGNPKAPAAKLFLAAVKAGEDPQAIIDGAKRFAAAEARNVGTPYIPQMVKWLRDKRWLDYGTGHSATVFNIRSSLV